jgi:hypothetical protein
MPSKTPTTGSLICAKSTQRRDQRTSSTLHKSPQVQIITNQVFSYIKVKVIQSLNNGKKLAEDTHGRPSIEYHSLSSFSHSRSQPSEIEPGQIGLLENHKLSKAEYTNTARLTRQEESTTRLARLFGWWACFAKSD